MWWRLLLLCLYAIVLFIVARILETVAFYESGFVARRWLDPLSLSVLRLKQILDRRGVSYQSIVEKRDFNDLIESSGDLCEGEFDTAVGEDLRPAATKNFTSAEHFYEEVEDTKDSVWLVQVSTNRKRPPILDNDWVELVQKLGRFGVRTGLFDCASDYRLCRKKGWNKPQLVLSYPKGNQAKDNVVLGSYPGGERSINVNAIFNWINKNIKSRVKEITHPETFRRDWLEFNKIDQKEQIRFVFFAKTDIPMSLPYLSVKFTGRVKMGILRPKDSKNIMKMLGFDSIPLYLIITPEGHFNYGSRPGEYFSYDAIELYLLSLCPEVNDTFKFSLCLVNLCAIFEFFLRQGSVFRRFGKFLWLLGQYNMVLLLLWLPLLGLFKLPFLQPCVYQLCRFVRFLSLLDFSAIVRQDIILKRCSLTVISITFIVFCFILAIIQRRRTNGRDPDMDSNQPWWSIEAGLTPYAPVATLTTNTQQDLDLEEGMEMLIERLAVPDLWLHPLIPTQYVNQLPSWRCSEGSVGRTIPGSQCVICLENYRHDSMLCGLPCNHAFHQCCIAEWLTRYKHCCPVCRWPAYKPRPYMQRAENE